jgi:hypothetical protein
MCRRLRRSLRPPRVTCESLRPLRVTRSEFAVPDPATLPGVKKIVAPYTRFRLRQSCIGREQSCRSRSGARPETTVGLDETISRRTISHRHSRQETSPKSASASRDPREFTSVARDWVRFCTCGRRLRQVSVCLGWTAKGPRLWPSKQAVPPNQTFCSPSLGRGSFISLVMSPFNPSAILAQLFRPWVSILNPRCAFTTSHPRPSTHPFRFRHCLQPQSSSPPPPRTMPGARKNPPIPVHLPLCAGQELPISHALGWSSRYSPGGERPRDNPLIG